MGQSLVSVFLIKNLPMLIQFHIYNIIGIGSAILQQNFERLRRPRLWTGVEYWAKPRRKCVALLAEIGQRVKSYRKLFYTLHGAVWHQEYQFFLIPGHGSWKENGEALGQGAAARSQCCRDWEIRREVDVRGLFPIHDRLFWKEKQTVEKYIREPLICSLCEIYNSK